MKRILVLLVCLLAMGATLAACDSAQWHARADIAQAQAVAAQANSEALQAQAQSAADIANSQAGVTQTAIWAGVLPGVLLLLVLAAVMIVGAVIWGNIQRDRIRAEQARQHYLMQLLLLDTSTPTRRQLPTARGLYLEEQQAGVRTAADAYPFQPRQLPTAQPLQLPDPRWLERL